MGRPHRRPRGGGRLCAAAHPPLAGGGDRLGRTRRGDLVFPRGTDARRPSGALDFARHRGRQRDRGRAVVAGRNAVVPLGLFQRPLYRPGCPGRPQSRAETLCHHGQGGRAGHRGSAGEQPHDRLRGVHVPPRLRTAPRPSPRGHDRDRRRFDPGRPRHRLFGVGQVGAPRIPPRVVVAVAETGAAHLRVRHPRAAGQPAQPPQPAVRLCFRGRDRRAGGARNLCRRFQIRRGASPGADRGQLGALPALCQIGRGGGHGLVAKPDPPCRGGHRGPRRAAWSAGWGRDPAPVWQGLSKRRAAGADPSDRARRRRRLGGDHGVPLRTRPSRLELPGGGRRRDRDAWSWT